MSLSRRARTIPIVLVIVLAGLGTAHADGPHATITRTSYGVPHIVADDFTGLGYGYGYSFAQDNICEMANDYVTLSAERSKYFGPDATYTSYANSVTPTNLQSDFFYQRINDEETVENLLAEDPPLGPLPQVRALVHGYTLGYNRYLSDAGGAHGISDARCHDAAWVREINDLDSWRRFFQLELFASQGALLQYIVNAAPPTPTLLPQSQRSSADAILASGWHGEGLPNATNMQLGSNAVALGSESTNNGQGMLLANPHFPWVGPERFTEFQLTLSDHSFNVEGAALFGVPLVLIGHTDNVAWSHTVSTAWRFTPYELHLVPGDPTSYIYDGQIQHMTQRTVTVMTKTDAGLVPQSHTFYETRYGPMFAGIAATSGVNIYNWTPAIGYTLRDANVHLRSTNQFFGMDQAQSVADIKATTDTYQGIPWVNTIASDSAGHAYYADHSVVPHVTNDQITRCIDGAVGLAVWQLAKLPTLDGSTSDCDWGTDPDAVAPGIYGPSHLPILFRQDYTENSNDSYWLPNANVRLEGYPMIIGPERTQRTLRTRIGFIMIEQKLAGGGTFALADLQHLDWENRQYAGELWRDQMVAACQTLPELLNYRAACPALAAWDLHNNIDSSGAVLWQRFAALVLKTNSSPWVNAFNASDPVHTPNGLNTANPEVIKAFVQAVDDLRSSSIPLDAKLGDWQYRLLPGDVHIPIHGGPGELGNFNAIYGNPRGFQVNKGYADVNYGSSFMMAVQFTSGCPSAQSMLSYSESTDPGSPHYADQTPLFPAKTWKPMLYCPGEMAADLQSVTTL